MHDRPAKLPAMAVNVVWASKLLTLAEKVVFYHDWCLDQDGVDGSYIAHESLATDRLGGSLTGGTVSRVRQRLKRLTLHEPLRRRDARNLGWVSTLPRHCIPRTYREVPTCAASLDKYLTSLAAWSDQTIEERPARSWTYFIQAGDAGPIKIGTASDVARRLEQLQTGSVEQLHLIGQTLAIREDQAHEKWMALRGRGEWFTATPELMAWISTVTSNPSGPPDTLDLDPVVQFKQTPESRRAAAFGGRGEPSALLPVLQAQLPSAFREKGVGAHAPETEKVERDPAEVRAEGWALIHLKQGKKLTPEERRLVDAYLARHPDRRKAVGE